MKKIEMLKNELENEELNFAELDNVMLKHRFYSVMDDGITEEVKEDKKVVYVDIDSGMCEVIIDFEITINNGEYEGPEDFYLKVTSVENF